MININPEYQRDKEKEVEVEVEQPKPQTAVKFIREVAVDGSVVTFEFHPSHDTLVHYLRKRYLKMKEESSKNEVESFNPGAES